MPARPSHRPASTVLVVAARRGHADAVHALLDAGERSCRDDPRLTCLLRDRLSFVEPHAELQPQRLQLYVRAAPAPLMRVHSGLGFSLRAAQGLGLHLYRLCLFVEASSAQSKTRSSKGVVSASSCRFRTRAFRALSNELWTSSLATDHWQEECFSELIFKNSPSAFPNRGQGFDGSMALCGLQGPSLPWSVPERSPQL